MNINYTENKKNDFFDIFPLREEISAENDDFSDNTFSENKIPENKNFSNSKSNSNVLSNILKDKEKITGYMYEAWHYRFVGTEIATYIKKHNITYDEYYTMFIDL